MFEIIYEPTGKLSAFDESLQALQRVYPTVVILSCDDNGYTPQQLDKILQQSSAKILGGVFPSIIYNDQLFNQGSLLVGIHNELDIQLIEGISQKSATEIDEEVEGHIEGFDDSVKTMLVFIDGLAKNIGESIDALFDNYGLSCNYIGGGSGSLSFIQKPSLFTNQGLLKDALVYAYLTANSSVGVRHGWKSIMGPFEVTSSRGTEIQELDYRPAFEVYKEVVDQFSEQPINQENFFDVAKSFPFGVNTLTDEKIVRDPILLDGSSLVCVGNVEEGSYVDILQGNKDELIAAAKAARDASYNNKTFEDEIVLFIDCISRSLFLGDDFQEEVEAVHNSKKPLIGALTFGEVANNGKEYLEFFNKTAVVGHIGHG